MPRYICYYLLPFNITVPVLFTLHKAVQSQADDMWRVFVLIWCHSVLIELLSNFLNINFNSI